MSWEPHKFKHESASAKLDIKADGLAYLSNVWSNVKGKGHASGLMQKIVQFADEQDLTLLLVVQAYGRTDGFDNDQLESFYSKFGFKRVPDSKRPYLMARPSQGLQGS